MRDDTLTTLNEIQSIPCTTLDLYKHIAYLKRRAEVTDQVIQELIGLAVALHPDQEENLGELAREWTSALTRIGETYGHEV